ncbi:MAG: HAD family phosphatase [Bacteroidetes bacterium]|nr:HAD family phosphatase [Bacteroidota bacterium]
MNKIDTIVFDLGGVLIDWNPDYVFKKVFDNEEEMRWFYKNICTSDWNEEQDAGRSLQQATEDLVKKFPEHEKNIRIYYDRWEEMLGGPINETVDVLKHLKHKDDYRLFALTNWSAETFPVALDRYDFLHWFHGRLVSGEEKMRKPYAEIYELLIHRFGIDPSHAVYIDDNLRNLVPAKELGFQTIHFQSPEQFKKELSDILGEELKP